MKYIFDIETYAKNKEDVTDYNGKYKPNPLKEQIVSISVIEVDNRYEKTFAGLNEKLILIEFWLLISDGCELIGFNSDSYDLPYLKIRSFVNGISIKKIFHIDLRQILTNNQQFMKGILGEYAESTGHFSKTAKGSNVSLWVEYGKWYLVEEHNKEDVYLTFQIYLRMVVCNLL